MAEGNYRMLDGIAWSALDGQKVELSVSANWLQFRTRDGTVVTFGQRKRAVTTKARAAKAPEQARLTSTSDETLAL